VLRPYNLTGKVVDRIDEMNGALFASRITPAHSYRWHIFCIWDGRSKNAQPSLPFEIC
jgi:hypothetical protein